jgi:hypothetical protein
MLRWYGEHLWTPNTAFGSIAIFCRAGVTLLHRIRLVSLSLTSLVVLPSHGSTAVLLLLCNVKGERSVDRRSLCARFAFALFFSLEMSHWYCNLYNFKSSGRLRYRPARSLARLTFSRSTDETKREIRSIVSYFFQITHRTMTHTSRLCSYLDKYKERVI